MGLRRLFPAHSCCGIRLFRAVRADIVADVLFTGALRAD